LGCLANISRSAGELKELSISGFFYPHVISFNQIAKYNPGNEPSHDKVVYSIDEQQLTP